MLDRQIEAQRAEAALAEALRVPDITPTFDAHPRRAARFPYGWRAGAAVTLPIFTTHRAGVLVEQTTLDQLRRSGRPRPANLTGDVTAAAAPAEAQRQLFLRYRDEILPQAQQVEQARAGRLPARADRHRGAAAGLAGYTRHPPAFVDAVRNSRPRSPTSSAR